MKYLYLWRKVKAILFGIIDSSALKNLIIFESHSDFCDNSRELFEYMVSIGLNKKYKMIWLVENKGFFKDIDIKNVRFISLIPNTVYEKIMYHYYFSVARFAFFTHRAPPFKLNKGEVFVNLWHGSGPKNPGSLDMGHNFDFILCSSDYFKNMRISKYSYKASQLLTLGNARNDLLFKDTDALSKIADKRYDKMIIWMPTYRVNKNGKASYNNINAKTHRLPIMDSEDRLNELNGILCEYNTLLIIKIHPEEDLNALEISDKSNIIVFTNEYLSRKGILLYSLLKESNALITDISSVYVDYLLTSKPIGFTIDDMKDYKAGYNFEDLLSILPGAHINNFQNFNEFIMDVIKGNDEYAEQRIRINDILNNYKDGMFSQRIVDYFKIN